MLVLVAEVNGGTDDFIIGDRVLLGDKPGVIAYLGEVKFASGEFAGLVLGKRDMQRNSRGFPLACVGPLVTSLVDFVVILTSFGNTHHPEY